MNTQDDTSENTAQASSTGFDRFDLSDDTSTVVVTVGSAERWDRSHLRRLRQSADLPGLVPVIDSDFSSDGKPFAVTPSVAEQTLADHIPPQGPAWQDCAAITEASARAIHEAHLRGLFHGSLSPDQVYVIGDDVAVSGIGLGLGGVPRAEYSHWIAPEVADGLDATERSDVYSLGKILEASLGESLEDVPRSIRRLIMWSGSDTPEARPPSALEFASILAEALGDERKTYSPAFIPTAEANSLAATASSAVTSHVPSTTHSESSSSNLGTVAAVTSAGGAAAIASQLVGDDEVSTEAFTDEIDFEADALADESGIGVVETADDEFDYDNFEDSEDDSAVLEEAITTGDLPEVTNDATVTTQLDDADLVTSESSSAFDSRQYATGMEGAAALTDGNVRVPAAETIEITDRHAPQQKSNRAGILVGAVLAAGLAYVGYQLFSDESPSNPAAVVEEAGDVAAASTSEDEEDPTSSIVDEEAESVETVETEADADEAETEEVAEAELATSASVVEGPISADDAALQIVHGIPDTDVDVYVDGVAVAPGFSAGTIAGPVELDPGSYTVDVYAAADNAPSSAEDRSDSPVLSETVTVGTEPASLYAHLTEDGEATLSSFPEKFGKISPAQGRIAVYHLASAPEVSLVVDGEPVTGTNVSNGDTYTVDLAAGSHSIAAVAGDGSDVVGPTKIALADGEVVTVTVIGSASDGNIAAVVQRFTGLGSAPAAVPTGNSNLLGVENDRTSLYLVGALTTLMAAIGGLVMMRRDQEAL